jgi:hypothetical protein
MRHQPAAWRLIASTLAATVLLLLVSLAPAGPAAGAGGPNLAAGRPASASGAGGAFVAANGVDGNPATYWESAGGTFPQWVQVDLGSVRTVDRVVLRLPAGWEARTQTLAVAGSADGTSFATLAGSAGRAFSPAAGNAVAVGFGAQGARYVRVTVTANTGWAAAQLAELEVYGVSTTAGPNLAAGRTMTASTATGPYVAADANDGNAASYWESANDAFPQWVQVDLGSAVGVNQVVLSLPGSWEARTQTLAVRQSADGTSFTDVSAAAARSFAPASGNRVTIGFDQVTTRYVRIHVTANSAWPAGQLAELEVYGPGGGGGDVTAPTAPSSLEYTQPAAGQVRLTWGASSDAVGVTAYDVYANGTLRASVGGSTLAYTDTQPASATVTYTVRARDAAGNVSGDSNAVTRAGSGGGTGTNLAAGKPVTASSSVFTFVAANANDGNLATYWESAGGAYPADLTVALGADASVTSVVVRLDPDAAWGQRTQTLQVLGREQGATAFTSLGGSAGYVFNSASANTVTIPVTANVADVRLRFTANTGAPGAQVAELQVLGTPAPNPDLAVTATSWTPTSPVESDAVTMSATVRNGGTASSGTTNVRFSTGSTLLGIANVGALAAGASTTVSTAITTPAAGTYPVVAKVDEANAVVELDETNNAWTSPTPLAVRPVASSDLVAESVTWTPGNPAAGDAVAFSVALRNEGSVASAGGAHGITLTVLDAAGGGVRTLTGSYTGAIAPGVTTAPVSLGTWPAADGRHTVRVVVATDANELPVKQANNTSTRPLFVGRGANLPYDTYEAEDGVLGGGAAVVGPNRTVGDLAGEASGRRAVTLNATGASVEFTTKAPTNTLVARFSIPDAPGGGGTSATLNVYVDGAFHQAIPLTSRFAWLYGNETAPGNSPGAGGPRHVYDEANLRLDATVPAGHRIRLQKDAANASQYAIDFVSLEQATAAGNPDPARYATPAGLGHQDVQNALDRVRMDTTGTLVGVYLPAGDYQTSGKFQVYGKAVRVVGAGPWFTRFFAPSGQENTDVGFRAESSANGSVFSGFAYFGNYTSRIDGPGKVFDFANVSGITIDNVWAEHMVCLYWGANTDDMVIRNSRIRNTFADGVNMTNGSTGNLVQNNEARSTGDDSFALFSAIDAGGADMRDNVYENLTAILPWRAAGIAVYGGYGNTFRNIHVADTLVYSGVTISSLDFGYPMNGFGADPPTRLENLSIVRAGGHFWGAQTFPGIWVFSASKVFQGIRVSDVDIVDPMYSGIMFQTNYVGGQPQNPITDTVFTNVTITGARRSGDAFDAKSGFGIWANELPEAGQGPAIGEVTFNHPTLSGNAVDIRNTTPLRITVNP